MVSKGRLGNPNLVANSADVKQYNKSFADMVMRDTISVLPLEEKELNILFDANPMTRNFYQLAQTKLA